MKNTSKKAVSVLSEFIETGANQKKTKIIHLDGSIGALMKDFLAFKESYRLSKLTINKIESHMSNFNFNYRPMVFQLSMKSNRYISSTLSKVWMQIKRH